MAHSNGDTPDVLDGANGKEHSSWTASAPLYLGLTSHQKYVRLDSTTAGNNGGRPGLNKYVLGCAILASFNSILLGYGKLLPNHEPFAAWSLR